jgi:hypothetical protein
MGLDFESKIVCSSEGLCCSSKSGGHAGPLWLSTGGCRGFHDQRKKMGLDFDPSFIPKYWL